MSNAETMSKSFRIVYYVARDELMLALLGDKIYLYGDEFFKTKITKTNGKPFSKS
ncbi:hypothetical protein HNQ88_001685 [Aureibacter tunicatorum]|uniref:Uncharacterized protein n=1 Tax=Aureibacter tunicatorum TaxID=866807 RepID=A0AAE4BSA3_9BACT|nr:hypothetical protein [Aureibacter tunicatorum]BDD05421.1 hypothetical protein AUTU_29040 [Aureibacter tunicatorum]